PLVQVFTPREDFMKPEPYDFSWCLWMLCCIGTSITAAAQDLASSTAVVGEAGGSGVWPAIAEARADLPLHTLYRPVSMPDSALPLLLWGNGGCSDNGLAH